MAIAYEAGAILSDMEFVQFHATALNIPRAPRFVLSEVLRERRRSFAQHQSGAIHEALSRGS